MTSAEQGKTVVPTGQTILFRSDLIVLTVSTVLEQQLSNFLFPPQLPVLNSLFLFREEEYKSESP